MDSRLEGVVIVNVGRTRKLKFLGLVSSIICLGLYLLLAIILFKHFNSPRETAESETTDSINTTEYSITSTSLTDANLIETYTNYSLDSPLQYETEGRPLGNSLYFNLGHLCRTRNASVSSIRIRLFNNWEDTAPLYIFIIAGFSFQYTIINRYAIYPEKSTTQWQTIKIPSRTLPITIDQFLAVGMQHSSIQNQIYAVKGTFGVRARNITENTMKPDTIADIRIGSALSYTVVQYVEPTTTKPVSVH